MFTFQKLKYRANLSKKPAERADFFTLTLQIAFATVTDHNVIERLP